MLAVTCLAITTGATLHFVASLYANGIQQTLSNYSHLSPPTQRQLDNNQPLISVLLSLPMVKPSHYNLAAKVAQWRFFIHQDSVAFAQALFLLEQSSALRPTWAPNYSEQLHFLTNRPLNQQQSAMVSLAHRYGAYLPSVQLKLMEVAFIQWPELTANQRIAAANQLIQLQQNWRLREKLETLVRFSPAAARMCQLLKFNQLTLKACQSGGNL